MTPRKSIEDRAFVVKNKVSLPLADFDKISVVSSRMEV
jgi:hypothetical protein